MALPVTFAGLSTAPMSDLDENFAAVGALTAIPCVISGTNAIVLTPAVNTPTIGAYANYQPFSGIVAATNTGAATARVSGLAILPVFKDTVSGPIALTGGELVAANVIYLVYDSALNSGSGGFHLSSPATAGISVTGTPSAGQIAQWTGANAIQGLATTGTGDAVLATGPAITLANGTGLPISSGLSGAGTGVLTALGLGVSGSGNIVLTTGAAIAAATFRTTTSYMVSTLPVAGSGLIGARAFVSDASAATAQVGGTLTGGGGNVMPVFCNGAAWVYG